MKTLIVGYIGINGILILSLCKMARLADELMAAGKRAMTKDDI